jgi:magnesium transporter
VTAPPPAAPEQPAVGGVIACRAYRGGVKVADVPLDGITAALRDPEVFVWLGLYEPSADTLKAVQGQLGLHELAIEDAQQAHQRTKIETYDDSLFLVLRTVQLEERTRALEFGETHVFLAARYLVTVRHGSLKSHLGVRARCEATPGLLAKGPGFALHALMDFVVDQYFPVVGTFEVELRALEAELFAGQLDKVTASRLYRLMRDLVAVRWAASPLVEVSNHFARAPVPGIPSELRPYFQDVNDHVQRINQLIDTIQQLSTTALNAHLALASVNQNEDMRRLAAWAAMLAVPTMIAGIYGMNFDAMPELRWRFGYPLSLVLMSAIVFALWRGFKRSGWL